MWRIRKFIESIQNLIVWFPIIWKDKPWDFHYYEVMLLHKIKLQRKYFEKRQFFVGWESEVRWMKKCEVLLTRLINDEYWKDEWDGKIPSKRGFEYQKFKHYYDQKYNMTSSRRTFADIWETKTRRLFWLIFIWRYERWWD